jgi:2-aminoadipate transaminase
MFTWLEVPEGLDAIRLRADATRAGVAYVPGAPFYPDGGGEREMRLSFSALAEPDLAEAIRRLAGVIQTSAAR